MPGKAPNHANVRVSPSQAGRQLALSGAYGIFRNNSGLKILLIALLVIDSMLALFVMITHQVIEPEIFDSSTNRVTAILHGVDRGRMVSRILAVFAFCYWINRSCKNAWLLDPPKMRTTPTWAVGYYFIPVISLWKPYVSMTEIRDASYGQSEALSKLLPLWWICWIACLALSLSHFSISHLLKDASTSEETLSAAQKISTIGVPTHIILNYLTIVVIATITRAQNSRAAQWRP